MTQAYRKSGQPTPHRRQRRPTYEVECFRRDGEEKGRKHDGDDEAVPENANEIVNPPPPAKEEEAALEPLRREPEPQQADEPVRCNRRDTTGGYE